MRRIFLFMNVSLDGYFETPDHDLSWSKGDFEAFDSGESGGVDAILLGRKTYEMMQSFWPTPQAQEMNAEVAQFMNETSKIVVSHHDFDPKWQNATVVSKDVAATIRRLKEQPGKDIIILGSNNLSVSLMQDGLIDEFQIVVNPVALSEGTPLFKGLPEKANLKLKRTHNFKSGAVLLTYVPGGKGV
jgi:dihydrofolate reductase